MKCRAVQTSMAQDFQAFFEDPVAQAHVAACPRCQAVLDDELLVRNALAAIPFPEVDEALLARLRAIPFEAEARKAPPADRRADPARPHRRWLWRMFDALAIRRRSTWPEVAAAAPSRRPQALDLLLVGAVAAVVALLLWPRGQTPPMGHATATPTAASVARPQSTATPPPIPSTAAQPSAPGADATDAAGPEAAGADSFVPDPYGPGVPSDAITAAGDYVQDFCVQPDQDRVLYILGRGKAESPEGQAADTPDLRILQLPLAVLRADASSTDASPAAASAEGSAESSATAPTVFADLGDLDGPPHTALTDIDCAAGGRVLVARQNQDGESDLRGDLWLLDGDGRRLNDRSLLWDLDEAPADVELSPDGQAALVLGSWQAMVHVLRLDSLPAGPPVAVETGIGLTTPSGAPGGRLVWSPKGRAFLLLSYAAEGDGIDVFHWDGRRVELLRHGPAVAAGTAAGSPTADAQTTDPEALRVTDTGEPIWDDRPQVDGSATADRLLGLSGDWLMNEGGG